PGVEPGALFPGGEGDIGLGPLAGHEVLLAVEARRAQPVLQRQIVGIADAHAPLLGRIDEEQTAERPERLAPQRLLGLLIEQDDLATGLDELGGGNQPGEPTADDDGIRIHLSDSRASSLSRYARHLAWLQTGRAGAGAFRALDEAHDTLGEGYGHARLVGQLQD